MHPTNRKVLFASLALTGAWPLVGQEASPAPAATTPPATTEEEVIVLSPFEVTTESDTGYVATETLAGTRIRSDLKDIGSAISVVTKDLMNDIGATDAATLLQYTTNTEVGGTRGVFSGMNGTADEGNTLRNPTSSQRTRGLDAADNTRDYFVSDIPWDSYNTDRIDILRGANSFLFGLGSPAGIQNASLQTAMFTNRGTAEYRIASYGSQRATLNVNRVLIDDVLAIRVAGLWDHENFRQEPAYENDERVFASLRWDPKLIKNPAFRTSFKVKYEAGDIKANRPRNLTPGDQITGWFRPVDNTSMNGGMGKHIVVSPFYPSRTNLPEGGQAVAGNANFTGWLSNIEDNVPYWTFDAASGQNMAVRGGFIPTGSYDSRGVMVGGGVYGKYYSAALYYPGSYATRAQNLALRNWMYGVYKSQSITDDSIFDFYNNLIDGSNKSEFQRWTAYNIDFSQTGWDDRVGLNLTFDKQTNKLGGESLFGWNPAIQIDIMANNPDFYLGTAANEGFNENVGRPFVTGGGNTGSGQWTRTERETKRASLFAELRVSDLTDNDFVVKLLGKHRFNGVASRETYEKEMAQWQLYGNSELWGNYLALKGITSRPPTAIVYLGDSLLGRDSASGADLPRITSTIELADSPVYLFDPTPIVNPSTFGNAWTVPGYLANVTNGTTQASNLENLQGWTYWGGNQLLRANGGKNTDLWTSANKTKMQTTSYSGSYQGFFWNNAFIVTLGWRYDEVQAKDDVALKGSYRDMLNLNSAHSIENQTNDPNYYIPDDWENRTTGHSISKSYALHLNKLFKKDPLPINVSVSYAKSSNFQATNIRTDVFGNPVGNPSGDTKEYGLTLSTKDNKYSLRVIKFETAVQNASVTLDSTIANYATPGSVVAGGLSWRNVFLYQNGQAYDYVDSQINHDSYRNRWTNAYPQFIQDANGTRYADGTPEFNAGVAASLVEMNKAITGWHEIQKWLDTKGFFQAKAWNFTPTGPATALVDRATYLTDPAKYAPNPTNTVRSYSANSPTFALAGDTKSKGYEFEFTANPTQSWRITFNAAKTDAVRDNVGGPALDEFVTYMDSMIYNADGSLSPVGKVPRWGNAGNCIGSDVYGKWRAAYAKMKLQQGSTVDEVRKWRFNLITNYSFRQGFLKGAGVGAAYRWQDKNILGYNLKDDGSYDLDNPVPGEEEDAVDFWLSYERKLTSKINWKIQLNVRNVFAGDELIAISRQPDGQIAQARIAPNREWMLTNTFSF